MNTDYNTAFQYQCATQILIWEITMGLRSTTAPFTLNDARLKNIFYGTTAHAAFSQAYDEIEGRLARHFTVPSFASLVQSQAPTHLMSATSGGYSITLTDSNSVLSQDFDTFSVPSGVTAVKNGNSVTITATAAALANGSVEISVTGRKLNVSNLGQMIWTATNQQTVTTFSEAPDPVPVYFKLDAPGSLTMTKTSPNNDVEGYCFKVYQHDRNLSWYGKSDSAGNIFVTDAAYSDQQTKVYTFTNLTDGTYSFLEVLSKKGKDNVFPSSWQITVTRGGATQFDHTYTASDFSADTNGDCRLAQVAITGLSGGGTMTMTINNQPTTTSLEIVKSCSDGKIDNISFKVEQYEGGGIGWWTKGTYQTDANGKITIDGLAVGTRLRVTEIEPDGYYCTSTNPQEITLAAGTNRLTFVNEPYSTLEIIKTCVDGRIDGIDFKVERSTKTGWTNVGTYTTDAQGKITIPNLKKGQTFRVTEIVPENYICLSENPQTITLAEGTNQLFFENEPLVKLEIVKVCSDGLISGITMTVEQNESGSWRTRGTYVTDAEGKISIEGLRVGMRLRVTETVPDGYYCTSTNPREITLTAGTNKLTFRNEPYSTLEIIKTSSDGQIAGIDFKVERKTKSGWEEIGTYTTDAEGKISILNLKKGQQFRVTEIVPENYICLSENPQTITLVAGTNTLYFENEPLAELEIIKTSSDGQISGISFMVERLIGRRWSTLGTYVTDSNGKIEVPDLRVGYQMRITEIVPENYICLSENPQVLTLVAGTNTVSFENKPVVRLELVKTSDDGNVDGIDFTLAIKRGRRYVDVGTYTTHDGGQISVEDLTLGATYRLTETVPEGYIGETPIQDFVAELGTNAVSFTNRLIRGSLKVLKVDKGTRTPLEGVGYRLLDAAGQELATDYTDANGEVRFENLAYGQYSYQEFEAPAGFALDETIYHFSIIQDGVEISKLQENEILSASIQIRKVDDENRPLSGVTFLLEFSVNDGANWYSIQYRSSTDPVKAGFCTSEGLTNGRLTTDADGIAVYSGLCVDTQLGTVLYRLTEVSTVDGYNLLAEPVFVGSIQPDQELELSFTVVNTPTFKMPATGGSGFLLYTVSLAAAGAAVFFMLVFRKKRRGTAA